MNKSTSLVVLVLFSFIFSSCMKISKKNAGQKSDSPTSSGTTTVLNPLTVVENSENSRLAYSIENSKIIFNFPKDWPEKFFVEVIDQDQKTTFPIELNPQSRIWSFDWPAQDRKFGFIFRGDLNRANMPLKEIEALPPISLKTSQSIDIISTYGINSNFEKIVFKQLTLLKGAQLFLKTFSGQVIIEDLTAESASIQSFPAESKADFDQPGLSGGRIEFEIKNGRGHLTLLALGQHGGDGSPGSEPNETLRGEQGAAGSRALFGDRAYCHPTDLSCYTATFPCLKSPSDSEDGKKGKKGFKGYPGQVGGNSGFYFLKNPIASIKINVIAREGLGGRGGPGGAGGEGGFGGEIGDGGKIDLLMTKFNFSKDKAVADPFIGGKIEPACASAKKGGPGPQGDHGDPGADGANGIRELQSL